MTPSRSTTSTPGRASLGSIVTERSRSRGSTWTLPTKGASRSPRRTPRSSSASRSALTSRSSNPAPRTTNVASTRVVDRPQVMALAAVHGHPRLLARARPQLLEGLSCGPLTNLMVGGTHPETVRGHLPLCNGGQSVVLSNACSWPCVWRRTRSANSGHPAFLSRAGRLALPVLENQYWFMLSVAALMSSGAESSKSVRNASGWSTSYGAVSSSQTKSETLHVRRIPARRLPLRRAHGRRVDLCPGSARPWGSSRHVPPRRSTGVGLGSA